MPEPKRYIVTKHYDPQGMYALELPPLIDDFEEDLTPGLDAVVKARYLEDDEVEEVRERPHIISVEEDVEDKALYFGNFDESALAYHELNTAEAKGYKGKGVNVAVLDTGVKSSTLAGFIKDRLIAAQSFIEGEEVEDGNGHGDFCCVAATPSEGNLIVGKVLSNEGSGSRSGIIAGMNWAVEQGAQIISMSLGGSGSSAAYDATIRAAKDKGCVVFAAAGNDGREGGPVNCPGNAPDAYAIAAIDHRSGQIADFSCRGPEVDFAAAGVRIYYEGKGWSGTSMATPLASRCYATLRGIHHGDPWRSAYKAFLSSLEDTPAPSTDDGAGVPKLARAVAIPPPGKPPVPEPETPTPKLPTMSTVAFLVRRVKERTLITKAGKPWAIAEPATPPKGDLKEKKDADARDVCCGSGATGCGGSYCTCSYDRGQ